MFKKAVHFTRPPQARQDALLPGQGRSEAHNATNKSRYVCARRRDGEPAVSGGEAYSCVYVEPPSDARCARRGITRLTFAHGRELVSAQCLEAGGIFQHPAENGCCDGVKGTLASRAERRRSGSFAGLL